MIVAQTCLTLHNPVDCSPLGSSVHGILQARILEWVAMPFSRGSKGSNLGLLHCRRILYHLSHLGRLRNSQFNNRITYQTIYYFWMLRLFLI